MAGAGRPTKMQRIANKKRNSQIIQMNKKYPADYIAEYFHLTKGRVSQIIKAKNR